MTNVWTPGWVPGQQLTSFSVVTANYTLTVADRFIEANAASGSIALTLPDATLCGGATYTFKRIDSVTATNTVTIATTASQTIDGASSRVMVFQYQLLSVLSDGTNWVIIESNYHGAELGYVEATTASTTTSTIGGIGIAAFAIPGLSITVIGAGQPVAIEFMGYGYNSTADTPFAAVIVVNGAPSMWAYGNNHITSGVGIGDELFCRRRLVLTAGTSYTFTVGMWVAGGTGHFYADNTSPQPMYLSVVGQ